MKFNEHNTQPYDWENEGVYVIELTDPVEGGEEGVSNRQAKELTRRTRNLHTRMTTAEDEIDALQEQTPIQVEAALRNAKEYTDGKDTAARRDMATADTAVINTAKDYADEVVAKLVDNSPEALNTLQELATALGNDPNFATTVMQAIGERMKTADVTAALAGKADKHEAICWKGEGAHLNPDNLKETGYYFVYKPGAGIILVIAASPGSRHPIQIFVPYNYSGIKTRSFNTDAGTWSPWVEMYHSGNDGNIYVNRGSVTDANTATTPGVYIYGEGTPNCPSQWGTILVTRCERYISQTAYQTESTNVWYRQQTNGAAWQQWRLMYHTGNLVAATQQGAGLMSPADKTKLDALQPAPLAAYKIAGNRTIRMASGPKASSSAVGKSGEGHYVVYHNIGSTNYYTIPTAYGSRDTVCYAFIIGEYPDRVEIGTSNMSGGFGDMDFQVVLMPKN